MMQQQCPQLPSTYSQGNKDHQVAPLRNILVLSTRRWPFRMRCLQNLCSCIFLDSVAFVTPNEIWASFLVSSDSHILGAWSLNYITSFLFMTLLSDSSIPFALSTILLDTILEGLCVIEKLTSKWKRGGEIQNRLLWRALSPPCSSYCAAAPATTFVHHPLFLAPSRLAILFVELLLSELDCSLQSRCQDVFISEYLQMP